MIAATLPYRSHEFSATPQTEGPVSDGDLSAVIRWFYGMSHASRVSETIAQSTAAVTAWAPHTKQHRRRAWVAFFFVSSAEVAEPLLDLSHDFVDLEWLQKGRFLFQLCTPCHQDRAHSCLFMIAFISNLGWSLPIVEDASATPS